MSEQAKGSCELLNEILVNKTQPGGGGGGAQQHTRLGAEVCLPACA